VTNKNQAYTTQEFHQARNGLYIFSTCTVFQWLLF